ncbi:hypothetical protein [Stenotrophomonas oahuensis]|uniref:Uncharacterized protein n=1 Tax=Stenotrophomonas oahuensis TaxID=3003271 RepID=A0ABY9YVD5_9GAMM|nr:hypothetical protein [Stenotrophomonas sp. A5586]WNH54831.1 hypothetical protein PDM29_20675 [Stenotrophomonas sp. A5586]
MNMTFRADGDANTYTLLQGDRWIASLRFNGELMPGAQEELLHALTTACSSPFSEPQACAAVLAGLRLLQLQDVLPPGIDDVLTNGGTLPRIAEVDIDELCERIAFPASGLSA